MNREIINNAVDLASDIGEVFLDTAINNGVLQDIPILGSAVKIARATRSVRDALYLKKLAVVLHSIDSCSPEDINSFLEKMNEDPKAQQEFGFHLIEIVDKVEGVEKAEIIGQLFTGYLKGRVSHSDFRRLCSAVNVAFIDDLRYLIQQAVIDDEETSYMRGLLQSGLTYLDIHPVSRQDVPTKNIELPPVKISKLGRLFISLVRDNT